MKQQLFDAKTGNLAGEIDVPTEIVMAAGMVEAWMMAEGVDAFRGIVLRSPLKSRTNVSKPPM